jgi:ABC-type transport system involved in multi-copper enzyme maturation permease subunit
MMRDLFRAEVQKILGNRLIAALLFWLWPIFGAVVPLGLLIIALLTTPESGRQPPSVYRWTDTALSVWVLPGNYLFGRLFFISLAVAIFAGEYQWGTWKTIVPRADRMRLLAAKYAAFIVLVVLAFASMSLLLTVGVGIVQAVRGQPYPPALTPDVVQSFVMTYLLSALVTMFNLMIAVAVAALVAMLTRSIIGGIIAGLFFLFGEIGLMSALISFGVFFGIPQVMDLARFTSALNVVNIQSWLQYAKPAFTELGITGNSLIGSFVVLAVWLAGLVGINMLIFQRQDLA